MQFRNYLLFTAGAGAFGLGLLAALSFGNPRAGADAEKDFSWSEVTRNARQQAGRQSTVPGPIPTRRPGQPLQTGEPGQAGQAALPDQSGTTMGVRTTDQVPSDASGESKYGTAPNQMSNVPGVPPVSPNGTSNPFGTGGRPIRLYDAR